MKDYPIIVNKKIVLIDDNQRKILDQLARNKGYFCGSRMTGIYSAGYTCTRCDGHKGPHVAHGMRVLAVWTEPIFPNEWEALMEEKSSLLNRKENK